MNRCFRCGNIVAPNKRFCTHCGSPMAAPPPQPLQPPPPLAQPPPPQPPPPPPPTQSYSPSTPQMQQVFRRLSAEESALWTPPAWPPGLMIPAIPMARMVFSLGSVSGARDQEGMLPPPPPVWGFQEQLTAQAGELNRSIGLSGLPARVVRAVMLDKTIYREAAGDRSLRVESWVIALAAISFGIFVKAVLSLSILAWKAVGAAVATQLLIWIARTWAIQVATRRVANVPLEFGQVFRAVVYAQAILLLSPIPYLGWLVAAWAVATTTAAIRDISGADTVRAFLVNLAGGAGALFVSQFVVPVLLKLI